MAATKPTIVKVVETALEEREPPQENEYEFLEKFPADAKRVTAQAPEKEER